MIYHRVWNKSNTTAATSGYGTVYLSGAPYFIHIVLWSACYSTVNVLCTVL